MEKSEGSHFRKVRLVEGRGGRQVLTGGSEGIRISEAVRRSILFNDLKFNSDKHIIPNKQDILINLTSD